MGNGAQAGWYAPDSGKPHELRYWDGKAWTDRHHTATASATSPNADVPSDTIPVTPIGTPRRQWWLAWPAIIVGFFLYVIPGVVLLWLRRGPHLAMKVGVSVLAIPVFIGVVGASLEGDTAEAPLAVEAVPSARASPSPEPSAVPTPTPTAVEPVPGYVDADGKSAYDTALEGALALTVKGRAAKTGYDRDEFGSGWVDVERNGCDTRNDMLQRRLTSVETAGACKVTSGTLEDPFTATTIRFVQGADNGVDIDHLVSLSDAWQKGAAQWEFAKRVAFANDPLNLEPVEASANRQKSDGDAATWLPSNTDYRCHYVARQIAVKVKYEVWATQAEVDAMVRVLDYCPEEPLPSEGAQPVLAENTGGPPPAEETEAPKETEPPKDEPKPAPKPEAPKEAPKPAPEPEEPEEEPKPAPEPEPAVDTRYPYCKDLPSGYGPYVRGVDPEYEWYTDRDGDGMVCE